MWTRLARTLILAVALLGATPALAADTAVIVDNSAPAASSRGQWSHATTTPGFHGQDYQFRVAGSGESSFSWPFSGVEGEYDVYARWTSGPNRAMKATYVVHHQAGQTSVEVNQRENGSIWHRLGRFKLKPANGQGVQLTDKADGVVVADAVQFVPAGLAPESGEATVPEAAASPAPTGVPTAEPLGSTPVVAVTPTPSVAPPAPVPTPDKNDPRYFAATRYSITEDSFWDYFKKRGGLNTFGYPVSNTFQLLGSKVQVFQRQIMQLRADGGVALLNLLDEGLMPYTKINGSTFPANDPEVIKLHPDLADPDYHQKAIEFIRQNAPDEWQGLKTNFFQAFLSTVRYEDAFPSGEGDRNLLPGFNLEIWGLPTSRPTYDPNNKGFVYLRFQRGIMHYDDACKCTQALLLADYLKSILLRANVPPDLLTQAQGSVFFGQYNAQKGQALNRPEQLPGTDLKGAFHRQPIVVVDAGHGGKEIGSSHVFPDGVTLREKDVNLKIARKVAAGLINAGLQVVETRIEDREVNTPARDLTGDGAITVSDDLQARVDIANNTNADLLLSIHFNGVSNPDMRGTYVFYSGNRPFSARSKEFAEMAQRQLVKQLAAAGYQTVDRGVRTDESILGSGHNFYLLGPQGRIIQRESRMPAALGEALFLTNREDANALRQERVIDAIAQAYIDAVKEYFAKYEPN